MIGLIGLRVQDPIVNLIKEMINILLFFRYSPTHSPRSSSIHLFFSLFQLSILNIGIEAFASEMSGSSSWPIGHATDDMTMEYSGWPIVESLGQPTATSAYDIDYASEDDAEYSFWI